MTKLALLIPLVLLSACQTSKPLVVTPTCPPSLKAEVQAEPKAPDDALVNDAATVFMASELLPWARDNARRLSEGRAWCLRGAK